MTEHDQSSTATTCPWCDGTGYRFNRACPHPWHDRKRDQNGSEETDR